MKMVIKMGNIRIKYRYKFLNRSSNKSQTIEQERNLRKEIREFLQELASHNVSMKSLCMLKTSEKQRNVLLNLTLSLIKDTELMKEFIETKGISNYNLSRFCGLSTENIEKFRHYLYAYIILFSNENFANLRSTLDIGTDFDGDLGKSDQKLIRGVKLNEYATTNSVLSHKGEFVFLDTVASNSRQGQFVNGVESIVKPQRFKYFIVFSSILIVLFALMTLFYYRANKTIHLVNNAHVVLSYNGFNKLVGETGLNMSGQDLVRKAVFSNKNLDTSLYEIIETGIKTGIYPKNTVITINVTEGVFTKDNFNIDALTSLVRNNNIKIKINLNNDDYIIIK